MTKDKNIYAIENEKSDEYWSDAPVYGNQKLKYLEVIDKRYLNMGKALVDDDIYIQERLAAIRWDVNSTRAQKFWTQSPNYTHIMNYSIKGSLLGTSFTISYIVNKLGLTFPTVTKIINEAEAEEFIYVYNKGDKSAKTSIAATEWLVIDWLKRYVPYRAEGWNNVLNNYDTNSFHEWWELVKSNPEKQEKFRAQMDQAVEKYKNKNSS
tara:strand:- start:56 stop:682 length:627 start_codon:yes stop_codon:yes gene_type:complete